MGSKWITNSIGDLGKVVTGKTPPTADSENYGGRLPFITPSDMKGQKYIERTERTISEKGRTYVKNLVIPPKTVFISCIGSDMGKVGMTKVESVTNQQINSVIVRDGIDVDFVYYNLYSRKEELQRLATSGSAQPILNKGHFSQLKIPLPPLTEQRAIAHILGTLDDKIELNRRMNETLEAMARAIFKSWFVDFEPIPGHGPHKEWQNSPLGRIPKGWEVGTLGDLCTVAIGGDWGADYAFDDSVEAICLRGVDLEHLRKEGWANAPRRWIKKSSLYKRKISYSDVLIAASGIGPCGRSLWVNPYLDTLYGMPVIYSNFCKRFNTPSKNHAVFVDRILYEMRQNNEIWEYINGTSVPNLNCDGLLNGCVIIIPTEEVLEKFFDVVSSICTKLFHSDSRTLAAIRDALLPKLLSGEIMVKDARKHLTGVV